MMRGGKERVYMPKRRPRRRCRGRTRLYSCPSTPRPRRRRIPFGVGCGDFGVVGTGVDADGAPVAVGVEVGAYVSVVGA